MIGQIILGLDLFLTFPPLLEHMPCEAGYDDGDGEDDEEELLHDVRLAQGEEVSSSVYTPIHRRYPSL